jgi:hypothetical protein
MKNDPVTAVQVLESPQAIEQVTRGEVEIQALLAVKRPRNPELSIQRTLAEATSNQELAAECFYTLRKGGSLIEGPSVRLAEIAARQWGNMRAGSRIVDVGDTLVTAQGYCWDLETNFVCYQERQRRITDKVGRRYSDDMIVTTANAAASISFREAVIKVIGKARLDPIWRRCKEIAVGNQKSMADRYQDALNWWGKAGVSEDRLLVFLGRNNKAEVTMEDLAKLIGLSNALREGEISIDSAFPPPKNPDTAVPKPGVSHFGRGRENGPGAAQAQSQEPGQESRPAPEKPSAAGNGTSPPSKYDGVGPGAWDGGSDEGARPVEEPGPGQESLGF